MPSVRCFFPALAAVFALAAAAPASAEVIELGNPADAPFPEAACPNNCTGIAHLTGYQVQIGTHKNPFLIAKPGKIVAFTIRLGKPSDQDMQFFTNMFGPQPQARISILKLAHKKRRARLKAQSDIFNLAPYLGSTPTFALKQPIPVGPRNVVALTIPTWAPAFGQGLGPDSAWRASRDPANCNDVQKQSAQQTINSLTSYGCFFRTARLLYSVTYIPDPPTTNQQAGTTTGQKSRR